jgi:prolyl-tRNA synthetase
MGANYLDDKGTEHPLIMGCYGIGVSRIVAAAIEASHDDNGIRWPLNLAPYEVVIAPLQVQNAAVMELAGQLERELTAAGVDVLLDDRDLRPGVKFKDVDLIGVPLRVVIGERGLKDGQIELKWRGADAARNAPAASATEAVLAELRDARAALDAECRQKQAERAGASESAGATSP